MSDRTWTNIEDVKSLPGEPWDQLVARHKEMNKGLVKGTAAFRFRRSFENTYRSDLSRFPNDPDAYVTGPESLQKLIDKRKRAGWIVGKPGSLAEVDASSMKEGRSAQETFDESLREAKEICGEA
jgi:hypothetical protein